MNNRKIDTTVRQYIDNSKQAKAIEAEQKVLKAEIIAYSVRYNRETLNGLTVYETSGRTSLDKSRLEAFLSEHGASLSQFETTGQPSIAIRVK